MAEKHTINVSPKSKLFKICSHHSKATFVFSKTETHPKILQQYHPFDTEKYKDNQACHFLPLQINLSSL